MYRRLMKIIEEKQTHTKFHMPGHKGRPFTPTNWEAYDTTELEGTDHLNDPKGILREMEEEISKVYQTKASILVVNGATSALMAALLGAFQPDDKVIVPRNAHRSVYSGLHLGRLKPIYLHPEMGLHGRYPLGVNREELAVLLERHPDVKGVVLTHPSYYGTCNDLASMAALCRKHETILIVDEAHGAHFPFSDNYPQSALELGADVVVHSTHKILSSLNPGALLHINSNKVKETTLRRTLAMLQTSSPSYPVMLSIARSVEWMVEQGKEQLDLLSKMHQWTRDELKETAFPLVRDLEEASGTIWDPAKLWICNQEGIREAGKRLLSEHKVELEWDDGVTLLAMAGAGSQEEDFYRLVAGLKAITPTAVEGPSMFEGLESLVPYPDWDEDPLDPLVGGEEMDVPLKEASGRRAADYLIPYPPGIPLVCPGERITKECIRYLLEGSFPSVTGLQENGTVRVFKEVR